MQDLRASPAGMRGSGHPCPGAISLEAQWWRGAATTQGTASMGSPDAGMGKPRTGIPLFSGASAGHHHSLCHLEPPEGCCHLFGNFCRAGWALQGVSRRCIAAALSMSTPWRRGCYTAYSSNTKGSPGTTGTFHWWGKPNSKVLCISRHKHRLAFTALEVLYLGIREEPWVLRHTMTWGQPQPPREGTLIACCTREGTPHPSPFLWDWLNWLLCPFDNFSGALHEKHHLYIRLRASIRPFGSDSFWTPPAVRQGLEMTKKKILFFFPRQLTNGMEACIGLDFLSP